MSNKDNKKTIEVNFTQALSYPFQKRNLVNLILLPGVTVGMLFYFATMITEDLQRHLWLATALLVLLPVLLGYCWKLIHLLQKIGFLVQAPDWTSEIIANWLDGLKIILCLSLLAVVLIGPSFIKLPEPKTKSVFDDDVKYEAEYVKAIEARNKGNYAEAIRLLDLGVSKNPEDPAFYFERGITYGFIGSEQKGIEDHNKCINANPFLIDSSEQSDGVSLSAPSIGAIMVLDENAITKAFASHPNSVLATEYTLQQWEKSHKTQEAINAYSKVIKRHKDYLLPILRRGAMYSLSHEYKSAISDFDEVIRNAPRSGGVYFLRGRAYGLTPEK